MKILHVVPYFPPAYAFGGPAKVAYEMCRELVKRGHDVTVYTSDARDLYSRVSVKPPDVIDALKVFYFKNASMTLVRGAKLFVTPRLFSKVKNEVKTFDVVHLHEFRSFQNVVLHHYAMISRVPYVLQAHGSLPKIIARLRLKRIYDVFSGYRLLRDAAKVIALSLVEAEQYKCMGVPEEKIAIIPNGIDLSEYTTLPPQGSFKKKYGINDNDKVVLYVGRIHESKGLDFLLNAFACVVTKLKNAKLVIAGPDDGYLSKLKTMVKAFKEEESVLISGPLYGSNKLEAYVDADLCVLPSRYETFPMSLLEAYACGKPIVASDLRSLRQLVLHEVTGRLVHQGNVKQLSRYMLDLLNNVEKSEKMGLKGKEFVEKNLTIEKTVDALERTYRCRPTSQMQKLPKRSLF